MRIKNFKKKNIVKDANIKQLIKEPEEIKSPDWTDENKFEKFQLLLTAVNLITKIKQANLSILTLKAWLIILEIIQLVKQMLKKI